MVTHSSKRKLTDMAKTELLEEVKRLYSENNDLKQKVRQAEHPGGRRARESLQAIQSRCAKHRRERKRLERLTVCVLLVIYAVILALDEYGLQVIGLSPMYFSTNLKWLIDDKIGSLLVATLGFSIFIPSQMTFPAPNLSFIGVSLFAIKQVIILFLPKWCIGCVTLFALFARGTLYFDRNQQVIFIAKNFFLILTLFPRLFRKSSYYLEAAALTLAFICVFDTYDWLDPLSFRCPVQYQIGAFALLLSWINFLIYVRCIPIIGIYVVMLEVISKKFLRFLPVLLVLICGFGFAYYALLQNQEVYSTPLLALIKTSLIMFEMNFDDRIYNESQGGINYYPVTLVLFIITGYVMTIFVINLLIGLAVSEIPTLAEQGKLLQSLIYYDNLSDYEILRLQIRSAILWIISHICCCCSSSFKYKLYRLVDRSFLRQRPILFLVRDKKEKNLPKRIAQSVKKRFLVEQIQESIDEVDKQRYQKRKKTKTQRATDEQNTYIIDYYMKFVLSSCNHD